MMMARHRRSMQSKRQHPITKEDLRQLKQPQHVSIVDRLVIMPIDAPKFEEIESAIIMERRATMLINAPTLLINAPTRKPKERRECIRKIEDEYDMGLDDYYVEHWFP
jgi:hypothetical protein